MICQSIMRGVAAMVLGVVFVCGGVQTSESRAADYYFDDFESYDYGSYIDGQGNWTYSDSPNKWLVHGMRPDVGPGQFLIQGNVIGTDPDQDFSILHLTNSSGFCGLTIGFDYLLETYTTARIEISPNMLQWTDVTSSFGLTRSSSWKLDDLAVANLSNQATIAGIQDDLYVRFSASTEMPAGAEYNWFAVDNLAVYGVPEPSTLVLLGIGAISLLGYAWRSRQAA